MAHRPGITVSYFGVNQAYQLALAAQELGALDAFYCSLFHAPGKWGGFAGALFGHDRMLNRGCAGLDPKHAIEIPTPLMRERFRARLSKGNGAQAWFETARQFDCKVARRL